MHRTSFQLIVAVLCLGLLMTGCKKDKDKEGGKGKNGTSTKTTGGDKGKGTDDKGAKKNGDSDTKVASTPGRDLEALAEIDSREKAGMGAAHPAEKVVGAESCASCHEKEGEVWRKSTHFTSFETMPKSDKAKSIAEKMGVMSITGDGACVKCHFTRQKAPDGKIQALSGVSCESCHGAAADWVDIHHDFGGDNETRKTETLAHREQRMMAVDKAGMIRSERLYDVALNCYECHTIPNEKLVNEAGHPTGSEFELVSRYQVEIRHNFFASDGENNDPAPGGLNPLHHMREMYVIGRMLDLEMTLRALQKATKKGPYLDYLSGRFNSLVANLKEIQAKVAIDEVGKALAAVKDLEIKENNATAYLEAAKVVTTNGREFAWKMSGGELGALDSLIPKTYKGKDLPRISATAGALGQGESIDRSNEGKKKKKE